MADQTTDLRILKALTGGLYRKCNGLAEPVVSILTYPVKDHDGDYVKPDGGDWSPFKLYPVVNWTHGAPIGFGDVVVKSLTDTLPDGTKNVTKVAVGTTRFFKTHDDLKDVDRSMFDHPVKRNKIGEYSTEELLECALQAERLIREDIATGVSIEFRPGGPKSSTPGTGAYWDLPGKSPLHNRPPRHFEQWLGLGYAHARRPVNPGCQTLASDPTEVIEKAYDIARSGKFGGEQLNPLILKAFTDDEALINLKPRVVKADGGHKSEEWISQKIAKIMKEGVRGKKVSRKQAIAIAYNMAGRSKKAFDDEEDFEDSDVNANEEAETEDVLQNDDTAGKNELSPGIRALLNAAQFIMDGAACLEKDIKLSDHVGIHKFCRKMISKLEVLAAECADRAETVRSELATAGGRMLDDDFDDEDLDDEIEEASELEEGEESSSSNKTEGSEGGKKDESSEGSSDPEKKQPAPETKDTDGKKKVGSKKFSGKRISKAIIPLERDPEGYIVLKSFGNWRPRRYSKANLTDVVKDPAPVEPGADPEAEARQKEYDKLMSEIKSLSKTAKILVEL